MRRSLLPRLALLGLLVVVPAGPAYAADDAAVRALGGACYWQTSQGLSESALAFRDRVEAALGLDLFRECDVREQTWGETVIECTDDTAHTWTLTLRIGFPGGLDRWQACITDIASEGRVLYAASFWARYRAQIAAAAVLYVLYALGRGLLRRRSP